MHTKVKFCGLKSRADWDHANELGVDFAGLVFAAASKRAVSVNEAKEIAGAGPMQLVAVFRNPTKAEVEGVLEVLDIAYLQFHGDEEPEFCESFATPYWKAFSYRTIPALRNAYKSASAYLIDSHAPGELAGQGEVFDWRAWSRDSVRPLWLAGGLNPSNVAEAIRACNPAGVDVSSGIENAPGTKDKDKMTAFMQAVRTVNE